MGEPFTVTLHARGSGDPAAVSGWHLDWGDGTTQDDTAAPDRSDPTNVTWAVSFDHLTVDDDEFLEKSVVKSNVAALPGR